MRLHLFGLNHRTTPVEIREAVAFGAEATLRAGTELGRCGAEERTILSTCNRAEIYASFPGDPTAGRELLERFFAEFHGIDREVVRHHSYHALDRQAAHHLLRVAASLDSQILGESEILRQVREAHELAREQSWTGPTFNRLFGAAIEAGKRVRTETAIGESTTSIAFAAIQLARKLFGKFHHRTALVVGAGEMAERIARYLIDGKISRLVVANRSRDHAEALLASLPKRPGGVIALDEIGSALDEADLVASSTAAEEPLLTREVVRASMRRRKNRPLFLVDIAVPRDVEPAVGDLYNVYLYHIDHLKQVVREGEARRRAEAVVAESIIESELRAFDVWLEERSVVPTIATLRRFGNGVAHDEVERALRKLNHLSGPDQEAIRYLGDAIVAKLLHRPTIRLKEAASEGDAGQQSEAVRYLFALEESQNGQSQLSPQRKSDSKAES